MARKKDSIYFHVNERPCYCVFENPYFSFVFISSQTKSSWKF